MVYFYCLYLKPFLFPMMNKQSEQHTVTVEKKNISRGLQQNIKQKKRLKPRLNFYLEMLDFSGLVASYLIGIFFKFHILTLISLFVQNRPLFNIMIQKKT